MIVVSACLAGLNVKYDGGHNLNSKIRKLVEEGKAVTVCPEVLGGLPTPRIPAEIIGGTGEDVLNGKARVSDKTGKNVTEAFLKGAYTALEQVQKVGASTVVLKERSPSCGSSMIYNGKFSGEKIAGAGVTTALLRSHGIQVISEDQFIKMLEENEF